MSFTHVRGFRCNRWSGVLAFIAALFFHANATAEIRTAYVWADRPDTASYTANTSYASVTVAGVQVSRSAPGRYVVDLRGFLPSPASPTTSGPSAGRLGNVQVSGYGPTGAFCQVVSWSASVSVACFDAAGRPADSQFSLLATLAAPGDPVSYAWAARPTAAAHDAPGSYALGASPVRIARQGAGQYMASLGTATATLGATVVVTAYGNEPRRCAVVGWRLGVVTVRCTNATGAAADSAFSILSLKPAAGELRFAFAWANDATSASYAPDARYLFAPEASGGVSIRRTATGRYAYGSARASTTCRSLHTPPTAPIAIRSRGCPIPSTWPATGRAAPRPTPASRCCQSTPMPRASSPTSSRVRRRSVRVDFRARYHCPVQGRLSSAMSICTHTRRASSGSAGATTAIRA